MTSRMLGIFGVLCALLLSWSVPATVHAAGCPVPFWGIHCDGGAYLPTAYGPVARATQISEDRKARFGNYSPLTQQFLPFTEWIPILEEKQFRIWTGSTDGSYGWFNGYAKVGTLFGAASWGAQYQILSYEGAEIVVGRWGIYNFDSQTFYPDATGPSSWGIAEPYGN